MGLKPRANPSSIDILGAVESYGIPFRIDVSFGYSTTDTRRSSIAPQLDFLRDSSRSKVSAISAGTSSTAQNQD